MQISTSRVVSAAALYKLQYYRARNDSLSFCWLTAFDINAPEGKNGSALFAAMAVRRFVMVELLLRRGADVYARAADNSESFFESVMWKGNTKIMKGLLEYGKDLKPYDEYYGDIM